MAKNKYLSGQPTLCQLLSFIPQDLIDESVSQHQSDRYYKTMTTFNFTNTGGTSRCYSNNSSKILSYFIFSNSSEGIKTQIWIALITQLIFYVIHRQIKEAEAFVTLVNVASNNMVLCGFSQNNEERVG